MDHIRIITTVPATPEDVYEAWLSSLGHTAMTGSPATSEPRVGASHSAWDGYISGQHVELDPPRRILQTWRTREFPEGAPDSLLEILFTSDPEGTRLTLNQSGIPDGQGETYHEGWHEKYFDLMRVYFATQPRARARKKPVSKASTQGGKPETAKAKTATKAKKAKAKPAKKTKPGASKATPMAKKAAGRKAAKKTATRKNKK